MILTLPLAVTITVICALAALLVLECYKGISTADLSSHVNSKVVASLVTLVKIYSLEGTVKMISPVCGFTYLKFRMVFLHTKSTPQAVYCNTSQIRLW